MRFKGVAPPGKCNLGGTSRADVVAVWPEATDAQLPRKSPHSVEPCVPVPQPTQVGEENPQALRELWPRNSQIATVTSEEGGSKGEGTWLLELFGVAEKRR